MEDNYPENTKMYISKPKTVKAFQFSKDKVYKYVDIDAGCCSKQYHAGVHYSDDPYNFKVSCTITTEAINDGDYVVILDTYNRKVMSKDDFEKEYGTL